MDAVSRNYTNVTSAARTHISRCQCPCRRRVLGFEPTLTNKSLASLWISGHSKESHFSLWGWAPQRGHSKEFHGRFWGFGNQSHQCLWDWALQGSLTVVYGGLCDWALRSLTLVVTFGVGSRCSSWAPWSFTVGSWLGLARSLAVVFGVGYSRTLLEKRSVVSEGSIRASSCWGVRAVRASGRYPGWAFSCALVRGGGQE